MAVAPLPLTPAYAISKAAAFNLTQSLRALLAGRGVRVHAVLTGPTDTDMTRGFDIPKASPESVARAIFDGVDERRRGHLPRSRVTVPGRELAQRGGQGARARECGVRRSSARRGVGKGTDVDFAQQRDVPVQDCSKLERRQDAMTDHKIVSRQEWQAARDELLQREKEHTRMADELARQRRELPWVAIEKDYRFDADDGTPDPGRALRRPLPAPDLPLHVRAGLRGGMPGQLLDGRRPRRPAAAPSCPRRDPAARFAGSAGEASGVQAADGLEPSLGLVGEHRLQLRLRRLLHRRSR